MNNSTLQTINESVCEYKEMREKMFRGVICKDKYSEIRSQSITVDTLLNNCTSNISPEYKNLFEVNRDFDNFCFEIYDIVNRDECKLEKAKSDLKSKFEALKSAFDQIDWQ